MKPLLTIDVYRFIALPNSKQQLQPAFILVAALSFGQGACVCLEKMKR
jgi:hypothetical protein